MSAPITGRERYEWLVPPTRAAAHAFIPGARYAICLKPERYGWEREQLQPGEPKRARCKQCLKMLRHPSNKNMKEVPGD